MAAPPLVVFKDVTKRFGDGPQVLAPLSFQMQPGEFLSLIGPSGCGKSTVLRLLAGLSPVSDGEIEVDGRHPTAATARIGFVFQDPTLLPWLTVADNVELPQKLQAVAATERSVTTRRILELVRLAEKSAAYPRQLSGGQKMRVSLARALALAPRILLLDEPFGALDEMTREHLNEELLAIQGQQDWAALFVTHSVAEAVFLSHRILVMSSNPGRIHTEVPVPLAWPRTLETRLTPEYHQLVAQVSQLLRSVEPPAG